MFYVLIEFKVLSPGNYLNCQIHLELLELGKLMLLHVSFLYIFPSCPLSFILFLISSFEYKVNNDYIPFTWSQEKYLNFIYILGNTSLPVIKWELIFIVVLIALHVLFHGHSRRNEYYHYESCFANRHREVN